MGSGIRARHLGPATADRSDTTKALVGVPFSIGFTVATSDSSISWVNHNADIMRVLSAKGYMTQAGAVGDTAVVNRIRAGTTAAITDVADLSIFGDKTQFDFSEIDDLYNTINPGDSINIATASSPACVIIVEGIWVEV